jgi:hypothetical protein
VVGKEWPARLVVDSAKFEDSARLQGTYLEESKEVTVDCRSGLRVQSFGTKKWTTTKEAVGFANRGS